MTLIGMAGFAEGAAAAALALLFLGVLGYGFFGLLAWIFRSIIAAYLGILIFMMTTILFEPWHGFAPIPTDDSDFQSIQSSFYFLACMWSIGFLILLVGVIRSHETLPRENEAVEPPPME